MSKINLILSICIFSIFLVTTSFIKTQTRIIEKKIERIDQKIGLLKKDFHETQLDFYYLSSPQILSEKIERLGIVEYFPIDFSRIYLNQNDFINSQNKITIFKSNNEKNKTKKK